MNAPDRPPQPGIDGRHRFRSKYQSTPVAQNCVQRIRKMGAPADSRLSVLRRKSHQEHRKEKAHPLALFRVSLNDGRDTSR